MKTALFTLTLLAALVAAVSGATRLLAAPPARASAVEAVSCAPLLRLPPATKAGQQVMFGHIKSLQRKGARYEMRFDPALFLTGLPASRAALEDTGSSDVPNDSYVVEEGHRLLTFIVAAGAHVTVLPGGRPCTTQSSVAKLAQLAKKGIGNGFWITIGEKYPSPLLSLDEQYHP